MGCTRVLVADDNGTYGVLLSRFVAAQQDMEVVGLACNGIEAVHLASMLQPDLVLMDLCMPELDGFEATRVLSARQHDVKVIALTAHREPDSEQRSLEAGASGFLRKADVDGRLIEMIRELANRGTEAIQPGPGQVPT